MRLDELETTIGAVIPVLLDELEHYGVLMHCIQTSALLAKSLHLLGVPNAYCLTVGVHAYNQAWTKFVDEHGWPEDNRSRKACNNSGAAVSKVGKAAPSVEEGNWWGHLVVIVPQVIDGGHLLVDASIMQANQPDFDIVFPPLLLRVKDEFVSGRKPATFDVDTMKVIYEAHPDDRSFEVTPAWTAEGLDQAASLVVDRLK